MKEHAKTIWTAAVLVAVGISCVALRIATFDSARPGRGDKAYRLTYEVRFRPARAGGRIRVALPDNTVHCRIYQASYSHLGLAADVVRKRATGEREAIIVAPEASREFSFAATFEIHVSKAFKPVSTASKVVLTAAQRFEYLRSAPTMQVRNAVVVKVLADLSKNSPDSARLLARIFEHVSTRIVEIGEHGPSDAASALRKGEADTLGKARAMVALCRAGRIPARLVTGFVLEESEQAGPHFWTEIYLSKAWVPYDPTAGHARQLPPSYLPVRRGGAIVRAFETTEHQVRFSINRLRAAEASSASLGGGPSDVLHLSRLPLGMQETLAILLLLPVGALVTAVLRNIVGLRTFGTFTPSLIAMSFLYADWRTGLVILAGTLTIGLAGRLMLNRASLLMVPRLSMTLTVLVLFAAFSVSVLDYLGLTSSAHAVILPMVILTMLIERFYITSEEDGLRQALKVLAVTLLVAACCLLVLRWKQLGRLALTFPEAELFVMAALVLIGRYSGYRLTELVRFRDVSGTPKPQV